PVLKSLDVIIDKMIVVVGVYKKVVIFRKHKCRAYMKLGKLCIMWVFNHKHFFVFVIQISSLFVTQVRICVSISNNLTRFLYAYSTMIGCNDNTYIPLGEPLEGIE